MYLTAEEEIFESQLPGVMSSYTNMQWHQRQFTIGFTYRFNRKNQTEISKDSREGKKWKV
ncbi:MAG: hypothetical protein IPI53_10300 [Saprospiraceae bacterium]|nr:hypothetical protein [Saprospiraceae bacterium]